MKKIEKHWVPLIILIPVLFLISELVKSKVVSTFTIGLILAFLILVLIIHTFWSFFETSLWEAFTEKCECSKFRMCDYCKKKS